MPFCGPADGCSPQAGPRGTGRHDLQNRRLTPTIGVEVIPIRVQEQEFLHRVPAIKQNQVKVSRWRSFYG